jgi:hypothetical protein
MVTFGILPGILSHPEARGNPPQAPVPSVDDSVIVGGFPASGVGEHRREAIGRK